MKRLLDTRIWPLAIAAGLLVVSAGVNAATFKVPNLITLPAILAAWMAACLVTVGLPSRGGGIGPSLLLTFFAGMLLMPLYGIGWLGAGCVKMHMALGGWIGCAYPAEKGAKITIAATIVGGLLTAIGMLGQAAVASGDSFPLFPMQVTLSLGALMVLIVTPLVGCEADEGALIAPTSTARDASAWERALDEFRGSSS